MAAWWRARGPGKHSKIRWFWHFTCVQTWLYIGCSLWLAMFRFYQEKIAINELSDTIFRFQVAFTVLKICRFLMSQLAWKTLYHWSFISVASSFHSKKKKESTSVVKQPIDDKSMTELITHQTLIPPSFPFFLSEVVSQNCHTSSSYGIVSYQWIFGVRFKKFCGEKTINVNWILFPSFFLVRPFLLSFK